MGWNRVESELDQKLLFRFDPLTMRVEIVVRRYNASTGRLRIKETVDLLGVCPADLAGTLRAVLGSYVRALPLQAEAGTAIVGPSGG